MQAVNDAKKTKEPIYGTFRPGDNKLNPPVEAYFAPEIGRVLRYDEIQPWLERKQLKYDEGYRKLHNAKLAAAKKETETLVWKIWRLVKTCQPKRLYCI